MSRTPIEELLDTLDRLNLEAAMALMAPSARVLVADGRRAARMESS